MSIAAIVTRGLGDGVNYGGVSDLVTAGFISGAAAPSAGVFAFSAASYQVAEDGLSILITVVRTGGSAGAVSVDYTTAAGTATPGVGEDYTETFGTLNYADGVTSQQFSVPILDDPDYEGNETIGLILSNPTGGASIGSPATAVLTIIDNETPPPLVFDSALVLTPATDCTRDAVQDEGTETKLYSILLDEELH